MVVGYAAKFGWKMKIRAKLRFQTPHVVICACKVIAVRIMRTDKKNVPDCIKVTADNVHELTWLPHTCGYRLVAQGHPLPGWHHLVCGDAEEVHRTGPSMLGNTISEDDAEWDVEA